MKFTQSKHQLCGLLYLTIASDAKERQAAYRGLFRAQLDGEALTGQRREPSGEQGELKL